MVKEYDKVEDYYADPNVNFGEGVKINFGSTDPAQALGQNVNVSLAPQANNQESFRTPFLAKLQNTKYDSSGDYNVLSGKNFSYQKRDYSDMLKEMGYTDKVNSGFNAKNILGSIAKGPIDLKSVFFDPKGLTGPTGKSVLNLGMISEMEMKAHYDNFNAVSDKYSELSETGQSFNSTDLGFAATIGKFHFSRSPKQSYYNGLKSHIDGGSGNGHQMLKTMEALEKGFDPTGYRLDGKNENNGGVAHSSQAMAAGITEDGYYVRFKPLLISRSRVKSSQKSAMRASARETILTMGASSTWIHLQKALLDGTMEAAIKESVSKVTPVRTVMIRRSQLLQSGVVVEDGPTLDEIHAEEKAAAAAAQVEEVDVLAAAEASAELSEVGDNDAPEETSEEGDGEVDEEIQSEVTETSDDSEVDYESMTVSELKELLKEAGKPVSGKKADLISRLQE